MRRFLRAISIIVGTVVLLGSFAPWVCGWMIIVGCSGNEYHGINQNDQPTSYRLLKFQPWTKGGEGLQPSHILALPDSHQIVEHRIGTAYGVITKMVYYEAKYRTPDDQVRITHATGAESLISHRKEAVIAGFILCPLVASLLFFVASRLKPEATTHSAADSALPRPSNLADTQTAS